VLPSRVYCPKLLLIWKKVEGTGGNAPGTHHMLSQDASTPSLLIIAKRETPSDGQAQIFGQLFERNIAIGEEKR
jgi:hypothetical protein